MCPIVLHLTTEDMEAEGRRLFLCIALHIDERNKIKREKHRRLLAYLFAVLSKLEADHEEQQKLSMLREYVDAEREIAISKTALAPYPS